MKTSTFLLCLAAFSSSIFVCPAPVQPPPALALQLTAGHPTLTLTGALGTVCSIQYASDLSPATTWTDRTLLQVRSDGASWTDPSDPTPGQRFYRALSVPAPADTNLVFIQPGTFTMGSPTNEALRQNYFTDESQHVVTLSRGFWLGKYLVTQGDYLSLVGSNPSYFNTNSGYSLDLSRPVESVLWDDATNYCAMRTQQEGAAGLIPTNYVYRLPTESEWEYACRAGTTTAFYLGSGLRSGQANFYGLYEYDASVGTITNTSGIILYGTSPVGNYSANGWGLYDMIGNVWEWCQDWLDTYPTGPVTDPQGPASGDHRVIRGGSYDDGAQGCRSANRYGHEPEMTHEYIGFRVVLAPAL